MVADKLNIFDVSKANVKILHFSWLAFFITFFMWFCHASLMPYIVETFSLSNQEAKALLFLNVALTIPARTLTGALVDRFGPRLMYSLLLAISGLLCLAFAAAQSYEQLAAARFLLGFSGAGFVIGIRLVTEWFPARQAGSAQGVYGGWGNFGAAVANFTLPALTVAFAAVMTDGWRGAVAVAGIVSIIYSVIFYNKVRNTPQGATYFSPKKFGPMEVSSWGDMLLYMLMCAPIFIAMAIICWRLSPAGVALLSESVNYLIWAGLFCWFAFQLFNIYRINRDSLKQGVPELEKYKFKQVAMLDLAYMVTFGSEVAVVSMLPLLFTGSEYNYSPAKAALLAGFFMAMNLIARPGGGYLSDKIGRKKTLLMTVAGSAIGYAGMSAITPEWNFAAIVAVVVFCSFFVQAGAGATFGVVPTIKRRLTGQIAGMTGAYGNVGAASFLLVNSFVDAPTFFMVIALSCAAVFVLLQLFLLEPKGQIAETLPDGTVQLIDVG
jgi:NNP family nitrate/nitrite transporter-like MFS transporter